MLDSKQCQAFLAVIESGSFDAAGHALCLTPSAVSLRVQALEKSLGKLLLVRTRPCVPTQAGWEVAKYLQHSRLLEENLLQNLSGKDTADFTKVAIAVNADTLSTWLLPSLQASCQQQRLVLDIHMDDQRHTHTLLETGLVNACVASESVAMSGCKAVLIGHARYHMVATQAFCDQWFAQGVNRQSMKVAPAIIFNHKDAMHEEVMLANFGLLKGQYPYHFIPSSDAFLQAVLLGLGYGMVPDYQLNALGGNNILQGIYPKAMVDVPLYWHHWIQQSSAMQVLTQNILSLSDLDLNAY